MSGAGEHAVLPAHSDPPPQHCQRNARSRSRSSCPRVSTHPTTCTHHFADTGAHAHALACASAHAHALACASALVSVLAFLRNTSTRSLSLLTLLHSYALARASAPRVKHVRQKRQPLPAKQRPQTRCLSQRPNNHHLCPSPTTSHNSNDKLSCRQRYQFVLLHAGMPTLAACRFSAGPNLPPLIHHSTT